MTLVQDTIKAQLKASWALSLRIWSRRVPGFSRPALGRSKDMASKRGVRVMCGSARRGTRGGGSQAHASACPSPEKHSKLSWPSNTYSSWPWQEKVDAAQAAERKHAQAGNFGRKRSGLS